jgi:hypothetical protein
MAQVAIRRRHVESRQPGPGAEPYCRHVVNTVRTLLDDPRDSVESHFTAIIELKCAMGYETEVIPANTMASKMGHAPGTWGGQLQERVLIFRRDADAVHRGKQTGQRKALFLLRVRFRSQSLAFVKHRALYTLEACRLTLVRVLSQKWPRSSCRMIWRGCGPP